MAYVTFERTGERVHEPKLRLAPPKIVLNAAAARLLSAASVDAVKILLDRRTRRFALEACEKKDRDSYAVSISSQGNQASISAKSFLLQVGLKKAIGALPVTWDSARKRLQSRLPGPASTP